MEIIQKTNKNQQIKKKFVKFVEKPIRKFNSNSQIHRIK